MPATQSDRAADLMRRAGCPVLPLAHLAGLLDTPGPALAGELGRDPRFRVLRTAPIVATSIPCPEDVGAAYAAALRRAGLAGDCFVLFADPARPGDDSAAAMLAHTLARLLPAAVATGVADESIARAAEVATAMARAGVSPRPLPAGPSTTPPPAARARPAARPPRRPPSARGPRGRGSPRG